MRSILATSKRIIWDMTNRINDSALAHIILLNIFIITIIIENAIKRKRKKRGEIKMKTLTDKIETYTTSISSRIAWEKRPPNELFALLALGTVILPSAIATRHRTAWIGGFGHQTQIGEYYYYYCSHVSMFVQRDYGFSYIEKDYLLNIPYNNTYWSFPFRFVCVFMLHYCYYYFMQCSRFRLCIIYNIEWAIELVPTCTRVNMVSASFAAIMHRCLMFCHSQRLQRLRWATVWLSAA